MRIARVGARMRAWLARRPGAGAADGGEHGALDHGCRATRRVSEGNGASPRKPLAQRQEEYARKLTEKREHAVKLQQEAVARECTFAPTLVAVTHDDVLSTTARTDDGASAPTEVTGAADTSVLTSQTGQSAANSGLFFARLAAVAFRSASFRAAFC